MHEPEVESGTVPDFVIDIVQTPCQQNVDAPLDLGILLADTKLSQRRHGSGTHNGVLQDDSVVDVPNILGRLRGLGTFDT